MVVRKDFELSAREPAYTAEEVGSLKHRTLVMVGDDDPTSLEHALDFIARCQTPSSRLCREHRIFLLQEKPALCNRIILDFLNNEPVPTVAPVRRARSF